MPNFTTLTNGYLILNVTPVEDAGQALNSNFTLVDGLHSSFTTHAADTAPHSATSSNIASRLVLRDGSGGFAAGAISATTGTFSGAVTGASFTASSGGVSVPTWQSINLRSGLSLNYIYADGVTSTTHVIGYYGNAGGISLGNSFDEGAAVRVDFNSTNNPVGWTTYFQGSISQSSGALTTTGPISGASYSGGAISGTTGTFSGAVTGASYSGGPISGTTGTYSDRVTVTKSDASQVFLQRASGQGMSLMGYGAYGDSHVTANGYYDGANFQRFNTAYSLWDFGAEPSSDAFYISRAAAGSNPATLSNVLTLSSSGTLTLTGGVVATTGAFTGAITGASYSGGAISGTTGTFSGVVAAPRLLLGSAVDDGASLLKGQANLNGLYGAATFKNTSTGSLAGYQFSVLNDQDNGIGMAAFGSGYTNVAGYSGNGVAWASKSLILQSDFGVSSGGTESIQFRVGGYLSSQNRLTLSTSAATFLVPIAAGSNAISGGAISGTTGTFTGAVTGTTGTFTGLLTTSVTDTAGGTQAKFGSTCPVYIVSNSPNIGYNVYFEPATGLWKYGSGSVSKYAAVSSVNPSTGEYSIFSTAASGNADATATIGQILTLSRSGVLAVSGAATFGGAVTGASYSGGAISGTTGTFSGAVTGAGYSGGPISGTTGTFTTSVSANITDTTAYSTTTQSIAQSAFDGLAVSGQSASGNIASLWLADRSSGSGIGRFGIVHTGSGTADFFWQLRNAGSVTPEVMRLTSGGNLSVTGTVTATSFSGSFTSPGSNTQVLFNDGGVIAGDAGMTYNKTTDALTLVGNLSAAAISGTSATLTAASTITTTGTNNTHLTLTNSTNGSTSTANLVVASATQSATIGVTNASYGIGLDSSTYISNSGNLCLIAGNGQTSGGTQNVTIRAGGYQTNAEVAKFAATGATTLTLNTASAVGLILKAAASQTGNMLEINSSSGSGGDLAKIDSAGCPNFPGADPTYSQRVGAGSTATGAWSSAFGILAIADAVSAGGNRATAIGGNATAYAECVSMGSNSTAGTTSLGSCVAIGSQISATGNSSIAIGAQSNSSHTGGIVLGFGLNTSAVNQLVIGGISTLGITDAYIGNGITSTSPVTSVTIQPTGGSGANVAGANWIIGGGKGTGTGTPGYVSVRTATALTSGSTLQSLTERGRFDSTGLSVTGAISATGAISGTTGTFSGAVTGASYSGGAISGTTGTFTSTGSFGDAVTISKSTNANLQLLIQNANSSGGSAAESIYIGESNASGKGVYLYYGNTANGVLGANTAFLVADGGATGGMGFIVTANAPFSVATNNTNRLSITGAGAATFTGSLTAQAISGTTGSFTSGVNVNSGSAASTSSLNPGLYVYFDGTSRYGMDLGYNSTSGKYRTRIVGYNTQDIAFSFAGAAPSAQSSYTDAMTIVGSTGNVLIGTPTDPASERLVVQSPTSVPQGIARFQRTQSGTDTGGYVSFYGGTTATSSRGFLGFGQTGGGSATILTGEAADSMCLRSEGDLHFGAGGDHLAVTITGTNRNLLIGSTTDATGRRIYAAGARNGDIYSQLQNTTSGTGAQTTLYATNDTSQSVGLGIFSSGTTAYGSIVANSAFVYTASAAGLLLVSDDAAGTISFATGGHSARWQLTAAGHLLPSASANFDVGSSGQQVRNIYSGGFVGGGFTGTTAAFSGAVTGASYSGGPISGTTGTFSGAITGASYSGGAISGTGLTIAGGGVNTTVAVSSGSSTKYAVVAMGRTAANEAFIAVPGNANEWITGSAAGDLVTRQDTGKMLWSADSGTTAHLVLARTGALALALSSASAIGLILKAAASQTGNMLEINSNSGTGGNIAKIDSAGTYHVFAAAQYGGVHVHGSGDQNGIILYQSAGSGKNYNLTSDQDGNFHIYELFINNLLTLTSAGNLSTLGGYSGTTGTFSGNGIQLTGTPTAGDDVDVIYNDSTAKSLALIAGSVRQSNTAFGPFVTLRGLTYSAAAGQRGNVYIGAGSPSSPNSVEGALYFQTAGVTRLSIDNAGASVFTGSITGASYSGGAISGTTGTFTGTITQGANSQTKILSTNVTIPTSASGNNCVTVGTLQVSSGGISAWMSVVVSEGGYSVSKTYQISYQYGTSTFGAGPWLLAPITNSGPYATNDFSVELSSNLDTLTLKIYRTGGTTGGTASVAIITSSASAVVFTASGTASSATAATAYYPAAAVSFASSGLVVPGTGGVLATAGSIVTTGGYFNTTAAGSAAYYFSDRTSAKQFYLYATGDIARIGHDTTFDRITINGSGGVGINTATLKQAAGLNLQYSSTSGQRWGFITSESGTHVIANAYYDGTWRAIGASGKSAIMVTSPSGTCELYSTAAAVSADAAITLNLGLQVGIGNTTSQAQVDIPNSTVSAVDSATAAQYHLWLRSDNNTVDTEVGIGFRISSINAGVQPGAAITHVRRFTNSGGDLCFKTQPGNNVPVTRMFIRYDGLVGIGGGTTANYLLDVSTASSSTNIRFGLSAVDSGGYLVSTVASQAILAGGAAWNGANWVAKATTAETVGMDSGIITFTTNSGLTAGNTFTPTERWRINSSGHFLAGADNSYDIGASGATRPRNLYVAGTGTFGGAVTAASVTVSAGMVPQWVKVTIPYTSFSTAATTNTITAYTLAAAGVIHAVKIKHSTAFSGGAITAYTVSVGYSTDTTRYGPPFNVFQTVAGTTFQINDTFETFDHGATATINATATSTGANLSAATAGSVDIWLLVSTAT
jgi:hypothetical protein